MPGADRILNRTNFKYALTTGNELKAIVLGITPLCIQAFISHGFADRQQISCCCFRVIILVIEIDLLFHFDFLNLLI